MGWQDWDQADDVAQVPAENVPELIPIQVNLAPKVILPAVE